MGKEVFVQQIPTIQPTGMSVADAIRNVRVIGGTVQAKEVISEALGVVSCQVKNELRMVSLGCGDDRIATRLEDLLASTLRH
jgi:hypothetical protein